MFIFYFIFNNNNNNNNNNNKNSRRMKDARSTKHLGERNSAVHMVNEVTTANTQVSVLD